MSLTTKGGNDALDGLNPTHVSLHTADPTDDGSVGELSGGSPAYARKAVTFAAAAGKSRAMNGEHDVDVPAGNTVSHYAVWDGADCIDKGPLPNNEPYVGQGVYKLKGITINAT